MFENLMKFLKKHTKKEDKVPNNSKNAAKERLHLVLMQDRANVSVDFLELMKQEIIEVIKKYIDIDESTIDVRLTNKENGDGTNGAPALYANIPIINMKNEVRKTNKVEIKEPESEEKAKEIIENISEKENKEEKIEEKIFEAQDIVKSEVEETIINNEKDENKEEKQDEISEQQEETQKAKEEIKSKN